MVSRLAAEPQSKLRLREVVGVRSHPTVVRLDHLDSDNADWISTSYYLTQDVRAHLQALRTALGRPTGCGIFLIGQFGSGKSHLLAYLAQQLRLAVGTDKALPEPTDSASPWHELNMQVVAISLLNHPAQRRLEDVVLEALQLPDVLEDRRRNWSELQHRFPQGLLLMMDELSEFLRSKSTPAAFHEDIRFLQFLGEWAQDHPLWILAALQEQIEHVGDLEHGLYRKIKDRYPLRLLLTPGHIVDLLSQSILDKKPGYQQAVDAVVADLRMAFPALAVQLRELHAVFPIHPATIQLLAEVRDRFSQARGVVDFVVVQLNGCPARHVEPFLDQPADSLLTPDFIVDHFRDLFEVQSDFVPLAQQLLPYYRQHLTELFATEKLVELAWRIIKLLMLTHVSPAREGLTADEATSWLLYRAARIDPARNRSVVQRVLDTLADQGRYVTRQDDRYALNLQDDGGAALDRFLEREKQELRHRGDIVLESLLPLLTDGDFHPFAFRRDVWQAHRVRWQFHDRQFFIFVGNEPPEPKDGLTLCIRLPWGDQPVAAGIRTVRPSLIGLGEEVVELAALVRARERFWSGKAASRLEARFQEHLKFFRAQLKNAYREAVVTSPDGQHETVPPIESEDSFGSWLDRLALAALRRTYPNFERFAPVHGPLPAEAYRSLMRFVAAQELGEFDADDYVKLIREAYLVPMQLLKRKQRDYLLPAQPENAELVRLVLPLIESETSPPFIYEYLQGPVYGLVPDQVSLLLVYLLMLGEIDILKGKTSYRESFETLPIPLQYDRVVPGRALRGNQAQELTSLCEGLRIRVPQQMTVMAQRRAAVELRRRVVELIEPLQALRRRLHDVAGAAAVIDQLHKFVQRMAALQQGQDELHAFQQFLFEFGTAKRFLEEYYGYKQLAEKLDSNLESLKRYQYLLTHPGVVNWDDASLAIRLESLGAAPSMDHLETLDSWLDEAQQIYQSYQDSYAARHQAWWSSVERHPLWNWRPNPLSMSRHLGQAENLAALRECRARAARLRCPGLSKLDFQPTCHCGFDGKRSSIGTEIEEFERLRQEVETTMRHFFAQRKVRLRMQKWLEEEIEVNAQTLAYVAEQAELPEVSELSIFDQYLAGIDLVKEVDPRELLDLVSQRTWEPADLLRAVQEYLARFRNARLRFPAQVVASSDLVAWCVEQSLRFGVVLPHGISADELAAAAPALQPHWIGPAAIDRLEQLGLGETIENKLVQWLLDGHVTLPPRATASPLVESIREILAPVDSQSVQQLAEQAQRMYQSHGRLVNLARRAWLRRLEQLARHMPTDVPSPLREALLPCADASWVVIDGLGLPLIPWLCLSLADLFPAWRLDHVDYALVSCHTTTDQWYRDLVESGVRRSLEKINVLDSMLHERFLPLDDLWRVALAELMAACRPLAARLPHDRRLLVFADHGFRIASDGRSYVHGGDSALERLVPMIHLQPR